MDTREHLRFHMIPHPAHPTAVGVISHHMFRVITGYNSGPRRHHPALLRETRRLIGIQLSSDTRPLLLDRAEGTPHSNTFFMRAAHATEFLPSASTLTWWPKSPLVRCSQARLIQCRHPSTLMSEALRPPLRLCGPQHGLGTTLQTAPQLMRRLLY
jgi:hypothetical protein